MMWSTQSSLIITLASYDSPDVSYAGLVVRKRGRGIPLSDKNDSREREEVGAEGECTYRSTPGVRFS